MISEGNLPFILSHMIEYIGLPLFVIAQQGIYPIALQWNV